MRFRTFIAALAVGAALMIGAARADGLTIGLIPAENNEEMIEAFEPMVRRLFAKPPRPVKVE